MQLYEINKQIKEKKIVKSHTFWPWSGATGDILTITFQLTSTPKSKRVHKTAVKEKLREFFFYVKS